jgi:hypothetical protein
MARSLGQHEAGRREGRLLLSYADFAAVAIDLVRRKVTRPRRIAAGGTSNGGLLIRSAAARNALDRAHLSELGQQIMLSKFLILHMWFATILRYIWSRKCVPGRSWTDSLEEDIQAGETVDLDCSVQLDSASDSVIVGGDGIVEEEWRVVGRPRYGPPWVGRVLGLYGPPFAGRPMGPKGPINFYWLA